jgi:putative membrane protein (TIGR04086 family)
MAVMPDVDRKAVGTGAAIALAVGLASIVCYQLADAVTHFPDESNWVFLFLAILAGGWIVGGFVAARRRPEAPFTHGSLAAVTGYLVFALIFTVINAATGGGVPVYTVVLLLTVAAFCGILGGLLATIGRTA